jgi:hypothetical protein
MIPYRRRKREFDACRRDDPDDCGHLQKETCFLRRNLAVLEIEEIRVLEIGRRAQRPAIVVTLSRCGPATSTCQYREEDCDVVE